MSPTQLGERTLFSVSSSSDDPYTRELWSFRVCGDAVLLTDSMRSGPMIAPPWPKSALVLRTGGDIVALDPDGDTPAELLSDELDEPFLWAAATAMGILVFNSGDGDDFNWVSFYRYADTDTPGLEPSAEVSAVGGGGEVVLDDELFFQPFDIDGLLRVSLVDLSQAIEASPVFDFAVTPSHLLTISGGEARLRDRDGGEEAVFPVPAGILTLTLDAETATVYVDDGSANPVQTILVDLESGARHEFDGVRPVGRAPDGRWVLDGDDEVSLADPLSGELQVLTDVVEKFTRIEVAEDGVLLVDGPEDPIRLVSYDGGDEELLASRSEHRFQRLSDGRVVTRVDVDQDQDQDPIGDLVVVDRGTLAERLIDTHVVTLWVEGAETLPADVVAYQVRDGERSGLYLVNLGGAPYP
ncbi:MAG: hypothetical protein R3A79_31215 [Nannocystaceae bacterium]